MIVENFMNIIGADFFTGVPDSQMKALCDYLMDCYGTDPKHHIIGANEGNCTALAAGYHLATGKVPAVYMQNSGEGNIINPIASLLNDKVYAIPVIFIIGWRGEPGVKDEPQHIYQGEVTLRLLDDMGISSFIVSPDTTEDALKTAMKEFREKLDIGLDVAFIMRKNALFYNKKEIYKNNYLLLREEIIRHITKYSGDDPVISTTGKASRELFEIRTKENQTHDSDFLTVGSMGHCSSIALGVALSKPDTVIWCIDGDGAVLMHLGALAVIANCRPRNLIHIAINNGAHESVGGQPTAAGNIDLSQIALGCGYPYAVTVSNIDELDNALFEAKHRGDLSFIEVKCAIGSRNDLGRPTTTALDNKENFMEFLKKIR